MIGDRQNQERQIHRLGAQRQLYSQAKKIFGVQVILSGPVAVLTALISFLAPSAASFIALWGITVSLTDLFVFDPWQKRLRLAAARIQEAFDCDVLDLPWNALKVGKLPDAEDVKEQWDKYRTNCGMMPPLSNWYSPAVDQLPLYLGRIACQRSNCWWDAKQRRRYAFWVVTGTIAIFMLVLWTALAGGFSVESLVVKVLAPLSPALLLGIRQFTDQIEAAERLDKLKEHSETLWEEALSGRSEESVTAQSRNLQDEIFENRRKSPLVFDRIFNWLREDYEEQMTYSVDELVERAKDRLG